MPVGHLYVFFGERANLGLLRQIILISLPFVGDWLRGEHVIHFQPMRRERKCAGGGQLDFVPR